MYNSVLFLWLVVVVCAQENKVVSIINSIYSQLDITTTDRQSLSYNQRLSCKSSFKNKECCGWRNPNGVGFQTTGDTNGESKFGEFPWIVAIFDATSSLSTDARIAKLSSSSVPVYIGGGSLIDPAVVLTTAHSVVSVTNLKVRAGEWDAQTVDEIYPYQERNVASKIIHKDFQRVILFNDIALLFLSSPMNTSIPNVGLACLPPSNQVTSGGTPCIATGWGKDKFGEEGLLQVILKKITIPIVERKQCRRQLRKTRLGDLFELHSSFICAGGEAGIDICKGDGGSPLVCPIENQTDRYMQIGMVAWGIECGIKDVPGVYVDVSKFRGWIDENLYNMYK